MAKPPPTRASIKVVKYISYRGNNKNWSNRYFFGDITTWTSSQFNAMADALVNGEKLAMSTGVGYVNCVGYNAGSEVPVFTRDKSGTSGSWTPSGMQPCPGDAAAVIRFTTTQRTSKNHPIYLFKYFHKCYFVNGGSPDTLSSDEVTLLNTWGSTCVTGISDGTSVHPICGPYGAVAQSRFVLPEVRHRDFVN